MTTKWKPPESEYEAQREKIRKAVKIKYKKPCDECLRRLRDEKNSNRSRTRND